MIFIVQIWSEPAGQPRPTTLQEAMALQDLALAPAESSDDRWRELTRELLARYPTDVAELRGDDGVWADDSLAQGCDVPCTRLAIQAKRVDEVMPFVAVTANRLGLNVTDLQSGTIHLADGTQFALPARADEEALSRAPSGLALVPMVAPDVAPVPPRQPDDRASSQAAPSPRAEPQAVASGQGSTQPREEVDDWRLLAELTARDEATAVVLRSVQTALVASLAIMAAVGAVACVDPAVHVRWGWLLGSGIAAWAGFRAMRAQEETLDRSAIEAALMLPPFFGQADAARLLYRVWRALD